jgi:hypothetical protein
MGLFFFWPGWAGLAGPGALTRRLMMAFSSCVDAVSVGEWTLPVDSGRISLPQAATFSIVFMEIEASG